MLSSLSCTLSVQIPADKKFKPLWLSTPSYTHLLSNNPSLLSLLRNCKSIQQLKQIHANLLVSGLSQDPYVMSSVFEFAAISERGCLDYALKIFRATDEPTIFGFNLIFRAFSTKRDPDLCIDFFIEMLNMGLIPNKYSYPFVRKFISSKLAVLLGKTVHGHATKLGLVSDLYVQSSLIHFYSECSAVEDARKAFVRIINRNVVCWSAIISGYVQGNQFKEALNLFQEFQYQGLEPNESILVSLLCACAHLGALERGRWIHVYLRKNEIPLSINLSTALINMYGKCGIIEEAMQLFDKMPKRNVLSWTSFISCLAINGYDKRALLVFEDMIKSGITPDSVTFINVLAACSLGGQMQEALKYFEMMQSVYLIVPRIEHYGCLVDILGRMGYLEKAMDIIKGMPIEPDAVVWGSLLNSCNLHKNVEMGEYVGRHLIDLYPKNDAHYVLLSNIYAHGGRWKNAIEIRNLMRNRGIKKCPGCSVIEVDGDIYEFFKSDESDPRYEALQPTLHEMIKRLRLAGYVPNTSSVLLHIDEEDKERVLCYHSEKLAIAFGLIKIDPSMPIRVVKNLRACVDCHLATKLISKVFKREIIVRDRVRFHHFKNGVCSCREYW